MYLLSLGLVLCVSSAIEDAMNRIQLFHAVARERAYGMVVPTAPMTELLGAVDGDDDFVKARLLSRRAKARLLVGGAVDQSLEDIHAARKILHADDELECLYAEALTAKGQYAEAKTFLEQYLSRFPLSHSAHAQLAQALLFMNDERGCERHMEKALELDPQNGTAYFLRAQLLMRRGKLEDALIAVDASISADPLRHKNVFALKGYVLAGLRRYPDAIRWARLALKLDPESRQAYFTLCHSYDELERPAAASLAAFEAWEKWQGERITASPKRRRC